MKCAIRGCDGRHLSRLITGGIEWPTWATVLALMAGLSGLWVAL